MIHNVHHRSHKILIVLDHGDLIVKPNFISDCTAETAINAVYSRLISFLDASLNLFIDRGSNHSTTLMCEMLHSFQSRLIPIRTEAPWLLEIIKRSHIYINKYIDCMMLQRINNPSNDLGVLLANVEFGCDFAKHHNDVFTHYHRSGKISRTNGSHDNSAWLNEGTALTALVWFETNRLRTEEFINCALHSYRREVYALQTFIINEKVWFPRMPLEWHVGIVA